MYIGLENALDLPHASTMCNQCGVVCPVKIPLPDLQRKLREKEFERGLRPWYERAGLRAWGWLARHPVPYGVATRIGVRALRLFADRNGMIHRLPLGSGWTDERDMPAPAGRTFGELYKAQRGGRGPRNASAGAAS
jgi:L-lactate dehydrogenase complex protein LldF